ncbi:3-hydroxyacyl-CoA dehydrogenase/enoyl-CoA hydratase family protein [Methylocella tundrae]|uniref:3-hydroxyacyl-CoA dehydrogenase/enoyl-CoA hydratase family protein n=1 Tax=Methylocella tundrae TaxID=227605 RepID=UPI002ADEE3FE|nr:3-hydroxyacyl-CoA dehydrogenase NAD-binding domain-containing protein [Methylocella tundrae]WPP02904.1 3-hydroxyacyl-CoA dehydrogenase NAD-binding domain-containing protein [Methylocella tundrae]
MTEIKKVAVIGAGVMGASIAAHVANAGVPVVLLDIVAKDNPNRSAIAEGALEKLLKADPAPFMSKAAAKFVTTGNVEDNLDLLGDCDWIIEAVIERLDVKQALYARIEAARKPGGVVSSNTSTIPLATLVEGLPAGFAESFIITHFFNPPRYMRLLEVVGGEKSKPEALAAVSRFADVMLGKSIVRCKDRPGFIANRLGVYWLQTAVTEAFRSGLDVEEVDAIIGRPMGIPKTGVFGLLDLVGLDLMPHITASLAATLPKDDPFHAANTPVPLVAKLIAEGYTGRKGKGGFYRLNHEKGKLKEAIDLKTGEFRTSRKPEVEAVTASGKDLVRLLEHDSAHGRYAWRVLGQTLAYAAALVGDAADEIESIDEAMRLGYNWKFGPFELIDQLGGAWFTAKLEAGGFAVPAMLGVADGRPFYRVHEGRRQALGLDGVYHDVPRPEGVIMLEDIKRTAKPVLRNGSAALWDIGDGVACFEFTTKMNAIDPDTLDLLMRSVHQVAKDYKALVIYNEGSNFSAGANLGLALFAANIAAWSEIENLVAQGQTVYRMLKYAPFPVVGAPSGLSLGGGCEILLNCDAVQAHAETYMGLVEVGVGLIPGWGGCKEMLQRWFALGRLPKGPMPPISRVFEIIGMASVAKSAAEAKEFLYLKSTDGVTMNRYRLLADAKAKALKLAAGYAPPAPQTLNLPGRSAKAALKMAVESLARLGKATRHDVVISTALADVLSGGDTDTMLPADEDAMLKLERANFMRLIRHPDTLARIEHMLTTGKPLRN